MDKLPVWCEGEEWCPITATANVIGKKWHPVIIHRLLQGPQGFNDLKRETGGITSKVLSESLEDLQDKGLVNRAVVGEKPVEVEYSLTDRGESLRDVINAMKDWGEKNLAQKAVNTD